MNKFNLLTFAVAILVLGSLVIGPTPARSQGTVYTVYFESDRDGDSRIYKADGTGGTPVTDLGCTHPSVTSDNSMLLYTRMEKTLWGKFWNAFYLKDNKEFKLTKNEIYDELTPVLSDDGTYAAFTTMRAGNLEIITIPVNNKELQVRITNNDKPDELPALDGNGKWVYYTGRADKYSYIFKAPSIGGDPVRVSTGATVWEEHSSVSSDDRWLAYSATTDENSDIWLLDQETGERTQLTTDTGYDGNPTISSDGMKIVFTSERDGNYEIYMMNRDGSGLERLTENESTDDFATIN